MLKIFRKILICFSLLFRGQFFILCQAISAAFIPACFFGMNKQIFYKLNRKKQPPNNITDELSIVTGTEKLVVETVKDLYAGNSETLEFYENFYRNGIELWAAKLGERVVGSVWLYTGTYLANWEGYDASLLRIGVEPTAKFFANGFVDSAYRGQRIFPAIVAFCTSVYRDNEFYSSVDELNCTSVRAHERIGFGRCAVAYYIRLGWRAYCIFFNKDNNNHWQWSCFRLPRGVAVPVAISNKLS
ncbi:MAG: hypothetical protein LBC74_16340 [Planctomycetaceae bacterium]|jgi:GNAT superfamily N-acetyltransferase|nr:hypothetical protein [Planctomycetaceae bacterium]